jgi:hypothetical protein
VPPLPGLAGLARTPSHRFAVGYDLPSLRDSGKSLSSEFSVNKLDGGIRVFTVATNHGDCDPGTPISRLAVCVAPIGRLAFPGKYKAIESLTFVG